MRVLQVVQKPQRRGAEIFARTLNDVLRTRGHVTRMVFMYPYIGQHRLAVDVGDALLDGTESNLLERAPGVNPWLATRLHAEIKAFQPDIVQANGGRTVKYAAALRRMQRDGSWRLIYQNIDDPQYWLRDPLRRLFYRHLVMPAVDGVVAVSATTLHSVAEVYGLRCPMVHIPNGRVFAQLGTALSKLAARKQLGVHSEKNIVLYLGNITQQKRPDRFVRIVHALQQHVSDLEAWFVGDGNLRKQIEEQCRGLGLDGYVRFWGYQDRVLPFLCAADVLAVTSDSEGIPGVVLEAGYLRCPIVGTAVGGMHECVQHGETGYLIAPDDEPAFCAALAKLLQDRVRAQDMGRNASAWIKQRFDMEVCAQAYVDFYERILSGKAGPLSQRSAPTLPSAEEKKGMAERA